MRGRLPERSALHRVVAWVLVLLATSPFTAPFSTCDLSALVDGPQIGAHRPFSTPAGHTVAVGHLGGVVAALLHEESFKDVVGPVVTRITREHTTGETSSSVSTLSPSLRGTTLVLRV